MVIGDDPDLEYLRGVVLQIIFRMAYAGPSAHHLDVASYCPADIALVVTVRDRPTADIGDDFHVLMGVERKAGLRRDGVIVPHA